VAFALEHPARQRHLVQSGEPISVRIVELLGFLLGVEVIEVAEELVEPVQAALRRTPLQQQPTR
jgi:xanthosine utilization system XapX-like protein